jgi:hypothetical protein
MATISPRTYPMDWNTIPSTPSFTTVNNSELRLTTNLQFAVLPAYNDGDNYEPEGEAFQLTVTGIPSTSTPFGNGLNISSETGVAVSDPSILRYSGDFTQVIACRIPIVSSDQTIMSDWNPLGTERNYRLSISSDYRLQVEFGDGSSNSNSAATGVNSVVPGNDYVIIFQRHGSIARLWAYEEGSDFIYDPGDYDPVLGTGNNLGETQIGLAPDDGPTSWEPLLSIDLTHSGSPTSASPRLYSEASRSNAFTSEAIYAHLGYDRAISYQEAAAHGFRPFRLFDALDLTSDVISFRGLERYSETGPKIYFGIGPGIPPYRDELPSGLEIDHPNFINSSWIQQSQIGAPGIVSFIPMMGINDSSAPDDSRIVSDELAGDEAGILPDHRKVSFNNSAYSMAQSSGSDGIVGTSLPMIVIDLEQSVRADSANLNIEAPIGFYSWFQREEMGIEFANRDFGDTIITGWERTQNNWVSRTDLEDKARLKYYTSNGGMVCPFYWDYRDEGGPGDPRENPGTDAVSRTDHLIGDTNAIFGGFRNRIRTTRYMAQSMNIPFWVAIRVDSAAGPRYNTQEVFDAQVELALRVGDGLDDLFQGVYIWGSGQSAVDNAVQLTNNWASNSGNAAGLYSTGGEPMASPFCCRHPFMPTYLGNTATRPRTSMPWSPGCTTDS